MNDTTTPRQRIEALAAELGLTMTTVFVPWSMSRNKGEKQPSLNWMVTLHLAGKPILTTDYMAGSGHCPSYRQGRLTIAQDKAIRSECERGMIQALSTAGKPIKPDFADILASMASDSDVLNHPDFESWADELGYDTDSRSAEATYRACLDIALKLRAAIGEDGLAKLREAAQDY